VNDPTGLMKRCTRCGLLRPISEFHADRTKTGGFRAACKSCVNLSQRLRFQVSPGLRRARKSRERELHPAKWREARNAENSRRQARQRSAVFDHYGWACACCDSTEDPTIDHVGGDGNSHRRELFGYVKKTGRIYGWLIREGFPAGFATLCRPCNSSKANRDRCYINHGPVIPIPIGSDDEEG
jgi:hypothetical protein